MGIRFFQALRFGPQYEYIGDNSNYYTTATSRTNSGTWQLNGAAIPSSKNMSVSNNRVLKVNGAAAGTTEIYTLVAGGKNIAKFTIKYVSNAGPSLTALVDDAVLARDYIALTGLDFDGDRNTPLEWDETNYGFFYPAYASNRGIGSGTHYGEYELMNVTPSVNHLIA